MTERLGLRENLGQFSLLVLANGFVGALVGIERAILPLLAERGFGLTSRTTILSFILSFGLAKAAANYVTGRAADRVGRKRILVAGWLVGLPVPLLLLAAPRWSWVVAANALLGVHQGMTWSTTVIMKIDLVGPRQRGLAMGLASAVGVYRLWRDLGYAVGATVSGVLADAFGLRAAILATAAVTFASGTVVALRMPGRRLTPRGGR